MWKPWIDDTPAKESKILDQELDSAKFAYTRLAMRVVKSEDEMKKLVDRLRVNMRKLLVWQKHLLHVTEKDYPQIPFDPVYSCIMDTQDKQA